MSVQVNYKNEILTSIANGATKTLNTSGTWVEDDIEIVDTTTSGSATTPTTTITANPSINVNNSTGLITATVSGSQSITPIVSAGYVSAGTAGTVSVSGSNTSQLTTKSAQTYTPGTSTQTIAAGQYLAGAQTISGDVNLVGSNILSGVSIFGVSGTVDWVTYYTGSSAPSSALGSNGDIYLQTNS